MFFAPSISQVFQKQAPCFNSRLFHLQPHWTLTESPQLEPGTPELMRKVLRLRLLLIVHSWLMLTTRGVLHSVPHVYHPDPPALYIDYDGNVDRHFGQKNAKCLL